MGGRRAPRGTLEAEEREGRVCFRAEERERACFRSEEREGERVCFRAEEERERVCFRERRQVDFCYVANSIFARVSCQLDFCSCQFFSLFFGTGRVHKSYFFREKK